jgi:hypothetical protein
MSRKKHREHHPQNSEDCGKVENANATVTEDKNNKSAKSPLDLMTIFTGILAFFAAASFIALGIQLRDARKSFATDQRPYVWMANDTKDDSNLVAKAVTNPLGSKQILATLRYANFGKSPAVLVRSYHAIVLGPSVNRIKALPWVNARMILPNGKVDFFSVVSGPINDQEIANYTNAEEGNGITVYGTWQYLDTSGNRYETEICLTRLNLGSWAYCKEHNDIKDCSESLCEP